MGTSNRDIATGICQLCNELVGIIWIIACSIGFVILMIVSLNLKDGSIARNISLLSLFSSGIIELKEYIIFIIGYATKR